MKFLRNLLPGPASRPAPEPDRGPLSPPAPEEDVYVVGDIHGRADLLERLLVLIDTDIEARGSEVPRLVFVGDYIDRGDDSAAVLDLLHGLSADHPGAVTCLMGNHERMMLDFLADPARSGPRWLRNGGLQTLASFRVSATGVGEAAAPGTFLDLAASLRDNMPRGLEGWLLDRPLSWNSASLWVVHAAADPAVAMSDQDSKTLLWGHASFGRVARQDGQWVAHGHSIVDEPVMEASRIAVDTGAVHTGRLTAAAVRPSGDVSFLST